MHQLRPLRHRRLPGLLLALTCALLVAACGGSEGSGPAAVASVSVVPNSGTLTFIGQVFSVEAVVRDGNGNTLNESVTWSSSAASVATVSADGTVTAVGAGVATIRATAGGVSGSATVTVAPAAASVAVTPTIDTVAVGATLAMTLTALDAGDTPIPNPSATWTTSNAAVATVSSSGVVSGVAPGTVTVTATVDGVSDASEITVVPTFTVTVNPTAVTLLSIGATQALAVTVTDSGGNTVANPTLSFATSDIGVATVAADGTVTAVAAGSATITVTHEGVSATVAVTVDPTPAIVKVFPVNDTIDIGVTLAYSATVEDALGTPVPGATLTWATSDAAVATIDAATGIANGIAGGTVTITATAGAASGSATLRVTAADVTIQSDTTIGGTVEADEFTVAPGATLTLDEDLTLRASGPVKIEGTVAGSCRGAQITSSDSIVVTGSISVACATAPADTLTGRVVLDAPGGVRLQGGALTASGTIDIRSGAEPGGVGPRGGTPGRRRDRDPSITILDYDFIHRPAKAENGVDNGPDLLAMRGVNAPGVYLAAGRQLFLSDMTIELASGGDGGRDEEQGIEPLAAGGNGGSGGYFQASAVNVNVSGTITVRMGSGGSGGDAVARAAESSDGTEASGARAIGGDGGSAGGAAITTLTGGAVVLEAGASFDVSVGMPGAGGSATAVAANGSDATESTDAQAGGGAFATTGDAGTPGSFEYTGGPVQNGIRGAAGAGVAQSGNGGSGHPARPHGAGGGSAVVTNRSQSAVLAPSATLLGGNGGHGVGACASPVATILQTLITLIVNGANSDQHLLNVGSGERSEAMTATTVSGSGEGGDGGSGGTAGVLDGALVVSFDGFDGGNGGAGTPPGFGGTAGATLGFTLEEGDRPVSGTNGGACGAAPSLPLGLQAGTQISFSAAPDALITVSGTLNEDNSFSLTGTGKLFGIDVTNTFVGTYDPATGALDGQYSVDTTEAIASGHPVIYRIRTN